MREAAVELRRALAHPCVVGKPVLVLATKHDMPGALSAAAVAAALELDTAAGLNRHAVQPVVARAGAGAPPDPRLLLGLEWLVAAVRVDWRALDARRGREMAAAAADATRRAARRSSAGATVAPAAPAALAPVSAPAPAAADSLVCSSCAVAPAARRCAAADWAAVCDDCGARLQRAAAARAAVAAAAADAAAAAAEPAPPVLVAPAAAHHTLEDSGCSFLTSPPSSPSLSLAAAVQTPDEGRRRPAAVAVGAGGGADASTGGSPLPAVASLRVTPADDGACCASCRAAPATCRTKLLQVTDDAVTGSDGRWSPACAACAAAADAVRGGAVAAALRAFVPVAVDGEEAVAVERARAGGRSGV